MRRRFVAPEWKMTVEYRKLEASIVNSVETPAFVLDQACLTAQVHRFREIANESGCLVLFSLKALAHCDVVRIIASALDGFSASSLFEAQFARMIGGDG